MIPISDLEIAIAEATLLRGRNSIVSPQDSLGRALDGTNVPASRAEDASSVEVKLCRSASELANTLQHGISLSLGGGPLPIPLLQARQTFFESLHTTVFSVSLVVQARRVLQALEVLDVSLVPGIELPANSEGLDDFVARFGDSYVSSLRLGGELQGVYTFFAQTREEARQVEQAFGGALAVSGFTLGPELQRKATEVTSSTGVNSSFRVAVRGLGSPPSLKTPEELEDFARGFGSITLDRPELLALETRGYETVPELRPVFAPVAANRVLFTGDQFGAGLLRQQQRLRELANQYDWVVNTYVLYGQELDASLATNRVQLDHDLVAIRERMRGYSASPSTQLMAPNITSLKIGSPRLNVKVNNGELMGGGGGEDFGFAEGLTERATAVQHRTRLVRVGLRAGGRIDQIRLTYSYEAGPRGATEQRKEVHGQAGGSDLGEMQLGPGVGIERIEAKTGTRVDRLTITTTDGQSLGGGGDKGNRNLLWERAAKEVVLGFSGRAGSELDALRAVVAIFGPVNWETVIEVEDP
jgi:hypothetical protein